MKKATLGASVRYLFLGITSVIALLPTYVMFTGAFKTQEEFLRSPFTLPLSPTLEGFSKVWTDDFSTWFGNTVIVTAGAVLVTTLVASFAAWGFANWEFPGKGALLAIIISLMVVPPVVLLIPLFQMGAQFGQISTLQFLIFIYVGLMLPFSVFMLTNFFVTIPKSLLEAASIDGASSVTAFVRIVFPLSRAPIATLLTVNALWAWNELLLALVLLQSNERKTLMIGLTGFQSRYSLDIPTVMAGMAIATLPLLALYLIGQRSFIQGITAGSVKGE